MLVELKAVSKKIDELSVKLIVKVPFVDAALTRVSKKLNGLGIVPFAINILLYKTEPRTSEKVVVPIAVPLKVILPFAVVHEISEAMAAGLLK